MSTMPTPQNRPLHRALISLSDKTGIVELAKKLEARGISFISTGGTAKTLKDAGLNVSDVSDITDFPEIMDGRVKTLHPKIHGGLLARDHLAHHAEAMETHAIGAIDLLICNLYPFKKALESGADYETQVENIDIGGPAMLRAAAKNHERVCVVCDPADYPALLAELEANNGAVSYEFRQKQAAKTYRHTANYDAEVANWLSAQADIGSLRYGENPHQKAAVYADGSNRAGVVTANKIQGKELSYNNLNDTDAAFELVAEFDTPTIAIIKHANPCGVATADTLSAAYDLALRCDPVSAFGGIIAANREIDAETAAKIIKVFSEVIIAPSFSAEAKALLATKDKVRVLETGAMPDRMAKRQLVKSIAGGMLVQDADTGRIEDADLKIVTGDKPDARQMNDMLFAWRVAKHVKSNAIVFVKNGATVGIGAGQMSRLDSVRIAAWKAAEAERLAELPAGSLIKDSVVSSDAFFPFADGLIEAAKAGASSAIQPGGSIRDAEVIKAAENNGLKMVFTNMRHFRH